MNETAVYRKAFCLQEQISHKGNCIKIPVHIVDMHPLKVTELTTLDLSDSLKDHAMPHR